MNDLTTTKPAEEFRQIAASRLIAAAEMTLHELVDEFQRLAVVIERETIKPAADDFDDSRLTPAGELASREMQIISGVTKSRFGLSLFTHDR
jgi:hypothetical protein